MAIFSNTASVSYNDITTNSNTVTGEILQSATVTKNVLNSTYGRGSTLVYAISIVNPSDTALNGVTVTDNLGGYTSDGATVYPLEYVNGTAKLFVNGVQAAAPSVSGTAPIVFGPFDIPADSSAILVYEAAVTDYAPIEAGSVITNSADISGANCALPASASASINVEQMPQLTVAKHICPDTVCGGGEISYTVIIQNSGNRATVATDNLVVYDTFDPALSDITVTLDGAALADTAYIYNSDTGVFSTIPGIVTVPAATYVREPDGRISVTPGYAVLKISGTI